MSTAGRAVSVIAELNRISVIVAPGAASEEKTRKSVACRVCGLEKN